MHSGAQAVVMKDRGIRGRGVTSQEALASLDDLTGLPEIGSEIT